MCGWGARVALDKGTSIYKSLEKKRAYTSRKQHPTVWGGHPFVDGGSGEGGKEGGRMPGRRERHGKKRD